VKTSLVTLLALLTPLHAIGKSDGTPVLRAGALPGDLVLDGLLDEPAWAESDSIPDLTTVEPDEGERPVGRTVVRVLAGPRTLVIGIVCYDPDPAGIVSRSRSRDAELRGEDHVTVVLDTFLDGRSGYVFSVNPGGARYDALVAERGEGQDRTWDAVWEAATARGDWGWSVEIRIPIQSLSFGKGQQTWGLNIERRVQRLQETSRWSGIRRDYRVTQTSRAGRLTGLPAFDLRLGLSVRPAVVGRIGVPERGAGTDYGLEPSLDLTRKLGPNLVGSLTVNTDFAETEVDARRINLTRFPLFFPEKRSFFLEGKDIFEFGLGLRTDVVPFFSRRIGLVLSRQVPLEYGAKLTGRVGELNVGGLAVCTGAVEGLAPATSMAVVRLQGNVLAESSVGVVATAGDPLGRSGAWTVGADFTYATSRFRGDKNFLVAVWGLAMDREGLVGDRTAAGFKIDYPNDLWDISFTYKRLGGGFQPSLGFVPRPGVQIIRLGVDFSPRPAWPLVRQMFYESSFLLVSDLHGRRESYRVFTAPVNWRLESGDRFEFNIAPEGERLDEPFEVADSVIIPPGSYDWIRYRLEAGLAAKRRLRGQITWWFGGFYSGSLDRIEVETTWSPTSVLTLEFSGERDIGNLPEGRFTNDLVGGRVRVTPSPDLELNSFLQYDNESRSFGSNTRLRWTYKPLGDLFVIYNHNVRNTGSAWSFDSNRFTVKLQYTLRY
jgi:hypothetical protein